MKTSTANSRRIKTTDHPKWPNWFSIKSRLMRSSAKS